VLRGFDIIKTMQRWWQLALYFEFSASFASKLYLKSENNLRNVCTNIDTELPFRLLPLLTASYDGIFLFPKLQYHLSGLEKLHIITENKQCKLRIDLRGFDNSSA